MNNSRLRLATSVLVCGALFYQMNNAMAQEGAKPGFTGYLGLSLLYDDNLFKTKNNTESDTALILVPELGHTSVFSKHQLNLGLEAELASYSDFSDENYNDVELFGDLLLDLTPKFNLDMGLNYMMGHDPRGDSGSRVGVILSPEPDTWDKLEYYVDGIYGRRTNKGQFEVKYQGISREYTNNNQADRDRDNNTLFLTAFYNKSAKNSYLVELRLEDISYANAINSDRDSTETSLLIGTRWEVTGQTAGEIRLGYLEKDYDEQGTRFDDFSGFIVEALADWTPQESDLFKLGLSRGTEESAGFLSNYYIATRFNFHWAHTFSPLMEMEAGYSFENDDYDNGRDDDLLNFYLGGKYDITNRFDVGLKYEYKDRSSNLGIADYKSNTIMLTGSFTPEW